MNSLDPEGPKLATRGGVNGSRSKFSLEIDSSAYIPKLPQALEPRSARIGMDKLSRSRKPRSQRGSKASRNTELDCRDRSDRLHRSVRPVRPVAPRQPANKAPNVKSRANEVQIQPNLGENFVTTPWTYPQKIHRSREIEERSKRIGVFSRTQNRQFVRTHNSRGFGTRLYA